MINVSRIAGTLGCAAILAASGLSASAATERFVAPAYHSSPIQGVKSANNGWRNDNGVIYHTPHYMMTRQQAAQSHKHFQPDIQLTYFGGAVLTTPRVYLILWGYNEKKRKKMLTDPNGLSALLQSYFANVGGSAYNNIYTQYYGPGSVHIGNPTGQLMGVWDDAKQNAIPLHPTDGQIAAEALRSIAIFGYDANGSYVVATSHSHNTSGFGTSFCAYHSAATYNGQLVSYTNLPYIPDAGSSCGSNIISPPSDETGADEGVTIVAGHEYAESITDPNPGAGWYNNQYGEIGDICAWQNIQNDPYGTFTYTAQPEFSNASSSCVHSY